MLTINYFLGFVDLNIVNCSTRTVLNVPACNDILNQ